MVALGAAILGLACLFYAYCLSHFGREWIRSRNKLTCYGLWGENRGRGTVRLRRAEKVVLLRVPQAAPARGRVEPEFVVVEQPAQTKDNSTGRKSWITVLPPGTGPLGTKPVAKESS